MPNSNSSFQTDSQHSTDSIVQNGGTILTNQREAIVQANAQRQAIIQANANITSTYNSTGARTSYDYWGWPTVTPGTSVYNNVSVTNAPGYPGTAIVNNGATMNHAVITSDGVMTANAGALVWGGTVSDGQQVNGGGTVYLNGGTMDGQLGNGVNGGNNINIGGTIYVNSGGTLQNGTAYAWNNQAPNGVITRNPQSSLIIVGSGGTVLHESMWQGASAVFGSGAQGTDITINVGTAVIQNGAQITSLTVAKPHYHYHSDDPSNNGPGGVDLTGQATVQNGGTVTGGSVSYAGTLIMNGNGRNIVVDSQYGSAGTEIVESGGTNINGTVSGGGIISVGNLGVMRDGLIGAGGTLSVFTGGSIFGNVTLNLGGTAFITPDAGGTIYVGGDDDNRGVILGDLTDAVNNGSTIIVKTEIQHFDDFDPEHPPQGYTPPTYDSTGQVWTGGDSDGIVLQGIKRSDIAGIYNESSNVGAVPVGLQQYLTGDNKGNYALIQTKSGGWIVLHIDGIGDRGVIGQDGNNGPIIFEVCYLEGTHILTPNGYKKVEDLYPGDLVETAHPDGTCTGKTLPLKWIGKKKMWVKSEDANLPPDEAGYAIRIQKDAFGDNLPEKDLWVTPEHSFLFEGKFVPVRMLVNGKTIAYDYERTAYTYYHLETDPHSILIAEGALSESYLDTGNRSHFMSILEPHEDADSSILRFPPKLPLPENANRSWQDAAAPFETSRAFVEPIWKKLAQRAELNTEIAGALTNALGEAITHESDFTVLFKLPNGKKAPLICKNHVQNGHVHAYTFALPPADLMSAPSLTLFSRKSRPCDAIGPYLDDRRQLGVLIHKIRFVTDQAEYSANDWHNSETLEGWANLENNSLRWTKGEATLPLPTSWKEIKEIKIEIIAQGPYLLPADLVPRKQIA